MERQLLLIKNAARGMWTINYLFFTLIFLSHDKVAAQTPAPTKSVTPKASVGPIQTAIASGTPVATLDSLVVTVSLADKPITNKNGELYVVKPLMGDYVMKVVFLSQQEYNSVFTSRSSFNIPLAGLTPIGLDSEGNFQIKNTSLQNAIDTASSSICGNEYIHSNFAASSSVVVIASFSQTSKRQTTTQPIAQKTSTPPPIDWDAPSGVNGIETIGWPSFDHYGDCSWFAVSGCGDSCWNIYHRRHTPSGEERKVGFKEVCKVKHVNWGPDKCKCGGL